MSANIFIIFEQSKLFFLDTHAGVLCFFFFGVLALLTMRSDNVLLLSLLKQFFFYGEVRTCTEICKYLGI